MLKYLRAMLQRVCSSYHLIRTLNRLVNMYDGSLPKVIKTSENKEVTQLTSTHYPMRNVKNRKCLFTGSEMQYASVPASVFSCSC